MKRRSWPMDKDLPDPQRKATYVPCPGLDWYREGDSREAWQLRAWREATGRDEPTEVRGPLMPPDEVRRVLMALGRKKLHGLEIAR